MTEKASDIFRILVNEEYNIVVNAQILSGLYVHNVLESNDCASRNLYETLTTRVKTGYLFRMPSVEEHITEIQLKNEFDECQEELLQAKFKAVIGFYFDKLSIRLGKLIPVRMHKGISSTIFLKKVQKNDLRIFGKCSVLRINKNGAWNI